MQKKISHIPLTIDGFINFTPYDVFHFACLVRSYEMSNKHDKHDKHCHSGANTSHFRKYSLLYERLEYFIQRYIELRDFLAIFYACSDINFANKLKIYILITYFTRIKIP
jgi:hypothetical protein